MAAKRKLFIGHAGELAHLLVRATGPGALIRQFVRSYGEQYDRQMLLNEPPNLREIESTIGREALLVMAAEIRRLVPGAFASGARASLSEDEAAVAQAFFAEFLASLSRAMAGSPQEAAVEAETFQRDLEMYDRWSARRSWRGPRAGSGGALESPFPDRCALLLDPSMMEQARQASADFENELAEAAGRIFDQLGRGGLSLNADVSRPRGHAKPKVKRAVKRDVKPGVGRTAQRSAAKRAPRKAAKAKAARMRAPAKKKQKTVPARKAVRQHPGAASRPSRRR